MHEESWVTLARHSAWGPHGDVRPGVGVTTRVLLVALPSASDTAHPSATTDVATGWATVAASLRADGFETEICDSTGPGRNLASLSVHIEHAWPDVVVAVADAASVGAACDVLRVAREIVPSATTVLSRTQSDPAMGTPSGGRAVDYVVSGADGRELLGLLISLRTGEQSQGARSRRIRRWRPIWSTIGLWGSSHGR